jgi:hypothetical protein
VLFTTTAHKTITKDKNQNTGDNPFIERLKLEFVSERSSDNFLFND